MVVLGAPDVVVEDGLALRGLGHGHLVEPLLEDLFDRGVMARADLQRARGRGFQPFGAKPLAQAEDADAGAVALLGMRLIGDDPLDE